MGSFFRRIITNPALGSWDYRRVLASSFFHSMGMTGEQVVIGYLVFQQTGSTAWVGISLAFYFGPMLIFGVPAGALADLVDRRRILPIIEGGLVLLLVVFGLFLHHHVVELWALLDQLKDRQDRVGLRYREAECPRSLHDGTVEKRFVWRLVGRPDDGGRVDIQHR